MGILPCVAGIQLQNLCTNALQNFCTNAAPMLQIYAPMLQIYAPMLQIYAPMLQIYAPMLQIYAPMLQIYAPMLLIYTCDYNVVRPCYLSDVAALGCPILYQTRDCSHRNEVHRCMILLWGQASKTGQCAVHY